MCAQNVPSVKKAGGTVGVRDPEFDAEESLREARSRRPFEKVLEELGHRPGQNESWKSFTCPHCRKKKKCGLFKDTSNVTLFKCHSTSCPSGGALDEVGYIAFVSSLSRKDAFKAYLKDAGVWKEREKLGGGTSEKRAEARKVPKPPVEEPAPPVPNVVPLFPAEAKAPALPVPAAQESGAPDGATVLPAAVPGPTTGAAAQDSKAEDMAIDGEPDPDDDSGLAVMREFYLQLTLSEQDEAKLYHDRGHTTSTIRSLGFRSNPKSNLDILRALVGRFPPSALLASGLFVRKDRNIRPSGIYYGWDRTTKKDVVGPDGMEWNYGWTHRVLIPYFNERGELIGLRPHKGMGRKDTVAGTPRLYVPRRAGQQSVDRFKACVITEGEFKGSALWQMVGGGSVMKEPWGVAALPGITFAKNMDQAGHTVREELDDWLKAVQCKRIVIAYDSEDKSTKELEKRHDARIWAGYLAEDLHRKLHVLTQVAELPAEWRNEKGKADWDGALARFVAAGAVRAPTLHTSDDDVHYV